MAGWLPVASEEPEARVWYCMDKDTERGEEVLGFGQAHPLGSRQPHPVDCPPRCLLRTYRLKFFPQALSFEMAP